MNEDVANRFDVSPTKSSFIFATWIKLLSKLLKNLVVWLPREAIRDNLPEAFFKTGNNKCRVILDCEKVFVERPIFIGISPSGILTFLSSCYGGRASDKFITKNSGFYDILELEDVEMVDCGFQIQEDLLLHFCNLQVPPGARTKGQMAKRYKRQKILQFHEFILSEQLIG